MPSPARAAIDQLWRAQLRTALRLARKDLGQELRCAQRTARNIASDAQWWLSPEANQAAETHCRAAESADGQQAALTAEDQAVTDAIDNIIYGGLEEPIDGPL